MELTGIINKSLLLHLVGCLYYLYQWCTVKQVSDNEIYLLIKYIKSVLWRVAKCLSYIEEARCLKVNNDIYFLGIGRACPTLCNLAFSSIAEFEPVVQLCDKWFNQLHALELWSDPHADLSPNLIRQLLLFSPNMTNMLFKGCEVLSDKLMAGIWEVCTDSLCMCLYGLFLSLSFALCVAVF